MASRKEYELLFQIRGSLGNNFNSSFKTATSAVNSMQRSLQNIKRVQSDISAYQRTKKAIEDNKNKISLYTTELEKLKRKLQNGEISQSQYNKAVEKTKAQITTANNKIKEEENHLQSLGSKLKSCGINTEDLTADNKTLAESYKKIQKAQQSLSNVNNVISANKSKISELRGELTKTVTVATAASAVFYKAFISPAASLQEQMSTVEAISGANKAELKQLTAQAKQTGLTTKFTATESAQAYEYMGMAGWKANQMISGLPGIINLAAASGEELSSTSDIVTDSLTAFKLQAKDSAHFSDVLAAAATNSNTNVSMMGESFKYAAPLAGSLKFSIEDTAVALGLMANSGIKASSAGTAVRSWLTRLAKPTKESSSAMKDLNLSLTDSDGKMKSFQTIMEETRNKFKTLTEAEKASYAAMLAGKTGMSGLLAIINTSDDDFNKLTQSINNADGAAKRMADTRLDNLNGDITLMKSAAEGAATALGEAFMPEMRSGVQSITTFLEKSANWVAKNKELIKTGFKVIATLVALKLGFTATRLVLLKSINTVLSFVKAYKNLKAAMMAIKSGEKAMSAISTAFGVAGGSIGLFVGVATVAIGVLSLIGAALYNAYQDAKQADLAERFGTITMSMDEMDETARKLISSKTIEGVAKSMEAFSQLDTYAENINSARSEIEKLDWKLSIGLKLTDDEKDTYKTSIDSYVANIQSYVEEKEYALQLGVKAVIDTSDENYSQIINSISKVSNVLSPQLSELGKKLQKAVQKAFAEDGLINIDAQKEANEILTKMSEIENLVTQSKIQAKYDMIEAEYSGKDLDPSTYEEMQKKLNEVAKEESDNLKENTEATLSGLYSNYQTAKKLFEESGGNKNENAMNEAKQAYESFKEELSSGGLQEKLTEPYVKAAEFGINTLKDAYPEYEKILGELNIRMNNTLSESGKSLSDIFNGDEVDSSALDAFSVQSEEIRNKWNELSPEVRDNIKSIIDKISENNTEIDNLIASYNEAGEEIPESIRKIKNAISGLNILNNENGTLSQNPTDVKNYLNTIGPLPQNALGTNYSTDMYIAGENGAELITGAKGSRVYTAAQTSDIYKNLKAAQYITAYLPSVVNQAKAPQAIVEKPKSSLEGMKIEINPTNTIYIDGNIDGDLEAKLQANNEELLLQVERVLEKISEDKRRVSFE